MVAGEPVRDRENKNRLPLYFCVSMQPMQNSSDFGLHKKDAFLLRL